MKTFRSYQLSRSFYQVAIRLDIPKPLRDQLHRASSSIALNLAEGYGRSTLADQRRFFVIALGSIRECQAVLDLAPVASATERDLLDHLAASVWKLVHQR